MGNIQTICKASGEFRKNKIDIDVFSYELWIVVRLSANDKIVSETRISYDVITEFNIDDLKKRLYDFIGDL